MAEGPAPTAERILVVVDLTVRYGPVLAVDSLSLSVGPAGAVALLGANGAGKTSALAAISRLVASEGRVVVDGSDVTRASPQAVARRGVAHVPEGRHLFPNLSVQENLQVARSGCGGRRPAFDSDAVYELFGALVPLRKRQAWSLSGGEQQMVAIGRALCAAPRILLLDEPSLGLAPVVVDALYDALQVVRRTVALVMVEQATDLALAICDEAYVLHTGRCVLHEATADLGSGDELLASYLDGA